MTRPPALPASCRHTPGTPRPPEPASAHGGSAFRPRRVALLALVGTLAAVLPAAPASAARTVARFLETYHSYAAGVSPASLAAADFDGDGRADLAVADSVLDSVLVFLNNGDGTLRLATSLATGARPAAVAVGEFDEQGGLDLAVACADDNNVWVFLGDGGGGFAFTGGFGVSISPQSVIAADLDGDTHADLALGCEGGNVVTVLLGEGDGFFGAQTNFACGVRPTRIAAADLNLDGKLDLAVANAGESWLGNGTIGILFAFGNWTLLPVVEYAAPLGTNDVAVTALDSDSYPDLVYGPRSLGTGSVLLRHGAAGGAFGPAVPTTLGANAQGPAVVVDVDGDNRSDVLVPLHANPGVRFHGALWSDAFAPPVHSFCPVHPREMTAQDFDQDGRLDLAVISVHDGGPAGGRVSILPGNGDGSFGPSTSMAGVEEPGSAVAGDLSSDGRPDLAVTGTWPGVSVFTNLGARRFASRTIDLGFGTASVAIGDLNGDGRADLCAANAGTDVAILDQLPDHTLGNRHGLVEGIGISGMRVADLNHDAVADLVFTEYYEWAVVARLGLGGGAFAPGVEYIVDGPPAGLAVADFDRDGHADAVALRDGAVSFLPGNGLGGFGMPLNSPGGTMSRPVTPVTAIDLDRDSIPDLVAIARDPQSPADEIVAAYIGNGDGTFQPPRIVDPGVRIGPPAVGDFDRNGVPDLAIPRPDDGVVAIWAGHGTGAFEPGPEFYAAPGCSEAMTADLDADGWLDLVVSNPHVVVLWNARGPIVGVEARAAGTPATLSPPRPNPVRARTTFSFALAQPEDVRLAVYDVTGRTVRSLASERLPAGEHRFTWDARNEAGDPAAAGVYFVALHSGTGVSRRRIVVLP